MFKNLYKAAVSMLTTLAFILLLFFDGFAIGEAGELSKASSGENPLKIVIVPSDETPNPTFKGSKKETKQLPENNSDSSVLIDDLVFPFQP